MEEASVHIPFGIQRKALVRPIRSNMDYGMQYGGRDMVGPNVPPPVQRSSLAQRILVHRTQISRYISRLTSPMSAVPAAGYPEAKVLTIIRKTPIQTQVPQNAGFGRPSAGGTMAPPSRFRKALPYPIVPYKPPVYGES